METHKLSSSAFATRIGVQRSVLSHLFSGRNNPSLDFVLRVVLNFDDVSIPWLILGDGTFPKKNKNTSALPTPPSDKILSQIVFFYKDKSFDIYYPNDNYLED